MKIPKPDNMRSIHSRVQMGTDSRTSCHRKSCHGESASGPASGKESALVRHTKCLCTWLYWIKSEQKPQNLGIEDRTFPQHVSQQGRPSALPFSAYPCRRTKAPVWPAHPSPRRQSKLGLLGQPEEEDAGCCGGISLGWSGNVKRPKDEWGVVLLAILLLGMKMGAAALGMVARTGSDDAPSVSFGAP